MQGGISAALESGDTMTSIATAAALAVFAATLGLPCDVLTDGRGGFVTRSAACERVNGILLGTSVRSARAALRRLAA